MSALQESASEEKKTAEHPGDSTLFSGVNWLGDSIMTMPAIREFRRRHPAGMLAMLSKPALIPLWKMSPAIDIVIELRPGPDGAFRASTAVRREGFERAFVMTQSFRSALVPFLAGVPARIGMPGHFRDWMLTAVVSPSAVESRRHQMFEYFDLLNVSSDDSGPPLLAMPQGVEASCRQRIERLLPRDGKAPLVGVLPGAAHGPSKCWPGDYFREVVIRLTKDHGCRIALFGSARETVVCASIACGVEGCAVDFSGKTSLQELAAMLSMCDVVIANDSGGMHLAAAVNTPVVAVFGLTDPGKTGPIGRGHRILAAERVPRSRDLTPDSKEARDALLSVKPGAVLQAALDLLGHRASSGRS
ncbi:MAG: lipopolysaccharide heptosyltransferase II [bacterium]